MKQSPALIILATLFMCLIACRNSESQQLDPFFWAAARGDLEQVDTMLKSGHDVNGRSNTGRTALMYASGALINDSERDYPELADELRMDEDIELVNRLLQAGADPNIRVPDAGDTALSIATYHGRLATVHALLEAGADPNVGSLQMSPLEIAAARCFPDIAEALLHRNAVKGTAMDEAVRHDCQPIKVRLQ